MLRVGEGRGSAPRRGARQKGPRRSCPESGASEGAHASPVPLSLCLRHRAPHFCAVLIWWPACSVTCVLPQLKEKAIELEAKKAAAGNGPISSKTRSAQKVGTADYASRRRELLQKRMQQRSVSGQTPPRTKPATGGAEAAAQAENS